MVSLNTIHPQGEGNHLICRLNSGRDAKLLGYSLDFGNILALLSGSDLEGKRFSLGLDYDGLVIWT